MWSVPYFFSLFLLSDGPVKTVSRELPDGSFVNTATYAYTFSDKLHTAADNVGNTTTYAYDLDDRVQTVTQLVTAALTSIRTTTYDALSRVSTIVDSSAGAGNQVLETHTYKPNGPQASFADARGNTIQYTYDGFDRLA